MHRWTDRSICDEVVTLLIAGHETTSTALAWAFERIVRHPPVLEQARSAVASGDGGYLDAVIRESLRSRPPLVDAVRMTKRGVTLAGAEFDLAKRVGRDIPTGTIIMVSIPLVHHRSAAYPEPAAFRPDRFLGHRPGPSEWVPFGGGRRRCLGAELAMMEMTKVLGTVLAVAQVAPDRLQPEQTRLFGTALLPSRRGTVTMRGRAS